MSKEELILFENKENANFFLLNDNTFLPCEEQLIQYIQNFKYELVVFHIKHIDFLAHYINQMKWDSKDYHLVAIGEGGKRVLQEIDKKMPIKNGWLKIPCRQKIKDDLIIGYDCEIPLFSRKKIVFVEDVVASGETIHYVAQAIKLFGGVVEGIVTFTLYDDFKRLSNTPVITSHLIQRKSHLFLDPPFYSFRHLVDGEGEKKQFYKYICNTYFKGDNTIEWLLQDRRT